MNMKSYFINSKLLADQVDPENAEKEVLCEMRKELERKDTLIKEKVKKLSRYR